MKVVEVHGLEELQAKMQAYPQKYAEIMAKTMVTGLLVLQENVPPYPPKPATSTYERTGTLGRSIGLVGGSSGIFTVRRVGGYNFEGRFGTNLKYAPRVIGDNQSYPFSAYWWKLSTTIGKSFKKLMEVYNAAAAEMARFLEGK